MPSSEPLYIEAAQKCVLSYGDTKVDCLTITEAVIARAHLTDADKGRATITTRNGTIYAADEIERFHYAKSV